MRSFIDLVKFEYMKIFKRKGSVIALIIIMALIIFMPVLALLGNTYVDGEPYETKYQSFIKIRDYARTLSGRYIDETLLTEAKEAYSYIPAVERYTLTPEYEKYGRPYSMIYDIAYTVYGKNLRLMQDLTHEQMQNFYQIRHDDISKRINEIKISDKSKEKLIELDSKIQTPFVFDYIEGQDGFLSFMYSKGIFAAFAIAICIAPIFAGEYGMRTDQLILSSKFGKNKIIAAKLFTGISFCAGLCISLTVLTYLVFGIIYGFDGANSPIQLWYSFCIYPFSIWQAAVVYSICVFFGVILICGITLLLSSLFKSPFGVIIIISVLLFVPMMFNLPENNILLLNLIRLLPSNMMAAWSSLASNTPYELFGLTILPYVFMPLFALIIVSIMLPFSYRSFKNHQIG